MENNKEIIVEHLKKKIKFLENELVSTIKDAKKLENDIEKSKLTISTYEYFKTNKEDVEYAKENIKSTKKTIEVNDKLIELQANQLASLKANLSWIE